jgi:hypothetical protein
MLVVLDYLIHRDAKDPALRPTDVSTPNNTALDPTFWIPAFELTTVHHMNFTNINVIDEVNLTVH